MKGFLLICGLVLGIGIAPAIAYEPLYLRTFRVPPDFRTLGFPPGDDPFSPISVEPRTAVEILTEHGVAFPPGASAFFNPSTSSIVVRNTEENMDLIEVFVTKLRSEIINQCRIHVEIYRIPRASADSLDTNLAAGKSAIDLLATVDALRTAEKAEMIANFSATIFSGYEATGTAGRPTSGCRLKLKPTIIPESDNISVSAHFDIDLYLEKPSVIKTVISSGTTAYLGQIGTIDAHATIAFVAANILPSNAP